MVNVECFPPKIRNKTRMASPATYKERERERHKRHPVWKLRNKITSICDMIFYTENPKESTKKTIRCNKQVQQSCKM